MSAFKRFKEKAKAQGIGLYQQVQAEAQQFAQSRQQPPPQSYDSQQAHSSYPQHPQYQGPPPQQGYPNPNSPPSYGYGGPQDGHVNHGPSQQPGSYHEPPSVGQLPGPQSQAGGWQQGQLNSTGVGQYDLSQQAPGPYYPPPPPPPLPPQADSRPQGYQPSAQQYPPPPNQYGAQGQFPVSAPPTANTSANEPPIHVATFSTPPPPPLQLRQGGEPNRVIWECPGPSRVVDYPTIFHHLPDVPNFLICTRCYERYIGSTSHAASFPPAAHEVTDGTCRFNVPRVVDSLWPEACRTGDLGRLTEYASKRLGIPACPGVGGSTAEGVIKWYEAHVGTSSGSFRVCEACFEERVGGTSFGRYFHQAGPTSHGGNPESCSLHHPYLNRALAECSKNPNSNIGWSQFTAAVRLRLSQPPCDGQPAGGETRSWRRPRNPALSNSGLIFCEECFLDQVGATPFANEFELVASTQPRKPSAATSSRTARFMNNLLSSISQDKYSCHAQIPSLLILLDTSKFFRDFSLFLAHAPTILSPSTPHCTENGISNGASWWVVQTHHPSSSHSNEFAICQACYTGIIAPYGPQLTSIFQQLSSIELAPLQSTSPRLCSFHPTCMNPPFLQSMNALQRVLDTGLLSVFSSFLFSNLNTTRSAQQPSYPYSNTLSLIASPPAAELGSSCPRSTLVPNQRWYGYQDCGICPSCYAQVCANTVLAPSMPIQNALVTSPTMCSMYSPRMRALYAQACAKNDPTELIEYAHTRALAHANTLLRAQALRQIRDIKMVGAVHQGTVVASMYRAGESFSLAAGGGFDGRHVYGNSSNLGWHPTQGGALAAQAGENMRLGMADASNPGTAMEIVELERRWLDFE